MTPARKFLLDANLSPRIGRALAAEFDIDILPLRSLAPDSAPDHEVIRVVSGAQRILITQDRDFADYFFRTRRRPISVIYLNLPGSDRTIAESIRVLSRFFSSHAEQIDFDDVLVTVTKTEVRLDRRPRVVK